MLRKSFRKFSTAVTYAQYGHPAQVLQVEAKPDSSSTELKKNQVQIQFLAAPINPADLTMVSGSYGLQNDSWPAIGGNEGVAVVTQSTSDRFSQSDRVIPMTSQFGTWRDQPIIADADELFKVDDKLTLEQAATLAVNPCTAYRLLADFETLSPGDVIIQNGANSAVGQFVIQLAKLRGIKTINVIRHSSEYAEITQHLKGLGGDIVCNDQYLGMPQFRELISDLPEPKLALNCVGGKSATNLARVLAENGTLVTYGGMAREPVTIPTSLLIFKKLNVRGFWLTAWLKENTSEGRISMLRDVESLMADGKLLSYVEKFKFADFPQALDAALKRTQNKRKVLLTMEKP